MHYLISKELLETLRMAASEAAATRGDNGDDDSHHEYRRDDAAMAEVFSEAETAIDKLVEAGPFTFADAVKTFAAPKDHWVHAALAENSPAEEGALEFDDHIVTSDGDDPGTYVMAWVWVPMPDHTAAELRIGLLGEAYSPDSIGILKSNGWAAPFPTKNEQAIREGWEIFVTDRDTGTTYELQAINEAGIFEDDGDAWQHVFDKAAAGSEYHRHALKALKGLNPGEYKALLAVCGEE